MKEWIRRWLGLTDIQQRLWMIEADQKTVFKQLHIILPGIGRIIAKLDPEYAVSEHDPLKKAASDKLAEETIQRLKAEDMARRHTTGDL